MTWDDISLNRSRSLKSLEEKGIGGYARGTLAPHYFIREARVAGVLKGSWMVGADGGHFSPLLSCPQNVEAGAQQG